MSSIYPSPLWRLHGVAGQLYFINFNLHSYSYHILLLQENYFSIVGRRWFLNAETRVQSRMTLSDIRDEESGTAADLSPSSSVFSR
jgi:hypothetical protein